MMLNDCGGMGGWIGVCGVDLQKGVREVLTRI